MIGGADRRDKTRSKQRLGHRPIGLSVEMKPTKTHHFSKIELRDESMSFKYRERNRRVVSSNPA